MNARRWLVDEGRVRPLWRILAYLALLLVLNVLARYAASVLPRSPLGLVGYLLSTASALVAGWIMLIRFDGRPPGALGFAWTRAAGREVGTGMLVGGGLIAAASALLFATGSARFIPDVGGPVEYLGVLAWTLLFFSLAAALEEALFRGYAFQALVEGIGVWPAVLITSALFSIAHAGNPNLEGGARYPALINIFLAGILLSFAYLRTRSLWFATAVHVGWNWTMASLIGFPVSGLVLQDTPLYDAIETGADWWTGGTFGPEAGAAASLVLVPAVGWMVRTRWLRESPELAAMRPLVDERAGELAA